MKTEGRRSYKKPEISEVKLVPEEAVLSNCKTQSGNAGVAPPAKCVAACGAKAGT